MNKPIKKFEYKIIIGSEDLIVKEDETLLNDLGNDGWELVCIDAVKNFKRDGVFGGKRTAYWLKREIEEG